MLEWRIIEDYPMYIVSNTGDVKRHTIDGQNRKPRLLKHNICVKTGYASVLLYNVLMKKRESIHVLVLEAFGGCRPKNCQVNHKDGNKLNNNYLNLEWVTRSENMRHAIALGLINHRKGERCHLSKLTQPDVTKIRELLKQQNMSQTEIARIFNIHQSTISYINSGKIWKG